MIEKVIEIPTTRIGNVIGLRGTTSTRIKIESEVEHYKIERHGGTALVKIRGSKTSVEKAIELTKKATEEEKPEEVKIHIPKEQVPILIGKSGSNAR